MTYAFPTRDKVTPLLKPTERETAAKEALIARRTEDQLSNPLQPGANPLQLGGEKSQVRTVSNEEPVDRK